MKIQNGKPILNQVKEYFKKIVSDNKLGNSQVCVSCRQLSAKEAIGSPSRQDYPIIRGREVMIESKVFDSRGQAFTDEPADFSGTINDVLDLDISTNRNSAFFIATLNSVLGHLGVLENRIHCKNDTPEKCGSAIAEEFMNKYGKVKIGLIGLNPAILDALVAAFGKENVITSDLNNTNIGSEKSGVSVLSGETDNDKLVQESDVVLLTGTTFVNRTFDGIWKSLVKYDKPFHVFGVTGAGICSLAGFGSLCPFAE